MSRGLWKNNIGEVSKFLLIFIIIFSWVFFDWPQIFNFLPRTQTVLAALNDATVEVLGGGGGGGVIAGKSGGGGGGGEYRRCTETLSVQSYTVTVGVGGTEDNTGETDSSFSGTGISMTADGGNGTISDVAGSAGTGGVSTNCDTAVANFDGGTPGAGVAQDFGGGGGGGAGYGGKGGNGASATTTAGGGGGEGGSETAAGNNASGVTAGSGGGGGDGGNSSTSDVNGSPGTAGTPATYQIVGGGGGGGSGAPTNRVGGACGAPGAGSGGGEVTGAGNGCRGEVRIVYVDSEIDATGGTETTSGSFRIHTFTTSGTFTVNTVTPDPTTFTQNDFEWFIDQATVTLTDPWPAGSLDLAELADLRAIPAQNNPPGVGEQIRLQINLTIGASNLSASAQAFTLQYKAGTDEDCSTGSWTDVGAKGATTVAWRLYDNTSLGDSVTEVNQILSSEVAQLYSETNPNLTNPNTAVIGNDIEYDWPIESVSGQVVDATTYAFRMVKSGGATISYTVGDCPTIETEPGTSNLMRHGNFFIDGLEKGFFWAD